MVSFFFFFESTAATHFNTLYHTSSDGFKMRNLRSGLVAE